MKNVGEIDKRKAALLAWLTEACRPIINYNCCLFVECVHSAVHLFSLLCSAEHDGMSLTAGVPTTNRIRLYIANTDLFSVLNLAEMLLLEAALQILYGEILLF